RLAEEFLVLDKHPVQFKGAVRGQSLAENHVAHVNRVRQSRVFGKFFERRVGIVVVHAFHCSAGIRSTTPGSSFRVGAAGRYIISVPHRSCRCTMPCTSAFAPRTTSEVIFFSSINANAAVANSPAEIVFGSRVMHSPAVRSRTSLPRFSSRRRKSPSLMMPSSRLPSVTVVTPSFLRDIS